MEARGGVSATAGSGGERRYYNDGIEILLIIIDANVTNVKHVQMA